MKTMKNFTDGIAVLLAILILIYALTLYFKFNPNEKKLEEGQSKIAQFIDDASTNRDHLRMLLVISFSALAGFLFRKRPEISGMFSVFAMCFILTLCENKQLPKYPNVIIILCMAHLAGSMAYTAFFDAENGTNRCMGLSLIGLGGALTVSTVCNIFQDIVGRTADIVTEMADAGLTIPDKMKFVPDAVRTVYRHFMNEGIGEARDVMYTLESQIYFEPMKSRFTDDIVSDQFTVYLRLSILLFGALILTVAFSRKYRFFAAAASLVPFIYEFAMLQKDSISCLPLSIITLSLFSFIMNVIAASESVRRPDDTENNDTGYVDDPVKAAENTEPGSEEDIQYT